MLSNLITNILLVHLNNNNHISFDYLDVDPGRLHWDIIKFCFLFHFLLFLEIFVDF